MFAEATGRFGSCEFASGWRFVGEELISKGIRRVFFTQRDSAAESHCDTDAGVALREDTRKIPYELAFGNRARKIEDRLDLKLQVTAEAWTYFGDGSRTRNLTDEHRLNRIHNTSSAEAPTKERTPAPS